MATAFLIVADSGQEVGTGSTSSATGLGTVIYDAAAVAASYAFSVTGLDFGELLNGGVPDTPGDNNDDVTAMHIHAGARGANGAVAYDLLPLAATDDDDDFAFSPNNSGTRSFSGVWETTDAANQSLNTFAAALAGAAPGSDVGLYLNIHSAQFGGGAIRGQWVCIADDNNNTVNGTAGNDSLPGLGGDDTVNGFGGNDTLEGGAGNDTLDGGSGDDAMAGGASNDIYVVDSAGDSVAEGVGAGSDRVNTTLLAYTLGANVERLSFVGTGNFMGTGNGLNNRFDGSAGADRFIDTFGGNDIFSGGAGSDIVDFRASGAGAGVDLLSGVHSAAAAGDTYASIERFWGSNTAADTMIGNTGQNIFHGFGGSDDLSGGASADRLDGGNGNDALDGGAGRDTLSGGGQDDTLTGGGDGDFFEYVAQSFGVDTVTDWQDGLDKLKVFSAVADDVSDFTITQNSATSVTLSLNTAPANTVTLDFLAAFTIANADFLFY